MPRDPQAPEAESTAVHSRWSRTLESDGFFIDEDRLRGHFHLLLAACLALLALLGAGLWRLQGAALAPPVFVGIADGRVFTGHPGTLADVREADFDRQLSDTVEVLFGRTEKGLPPEIQEFCAPEVVAEVNRAYQDAKRRYPAGYAQSLSVLETKIVVSQPGYREVYYRGLLSSRSAAAAQASPIYLDCTFAIRAPTALNTTGWKLARANALSREDYYRTEREHAMRQTLNLPPLP
jgi:hypothetical protein